MINAKKKRVMRWRTVWWESFYYSNSFTDEKSFDYIKELYRNTFKKIQAEQTVKRS